MDILNTGRSYNFMIIDDTTNKIVGIIHYKVNLINETATIDIIDKDNLPGIIKWFLTKSTSPDKLLIHFIKDRVNPSNRMFLDEEMHKLGIEPRDWMARMKLNHGRSLCDHYSVEWEEVDDLEKI